MMRFQSGSVAKDLASIQVIHKKFGQYIMNLFDLFWISGLLITIIWLLEEIRTQLKRLNNKLDAMHYLTFEDADNQDV